MVYTPATRIFYLEYDKGQTLWGDIIYLDSEGVQFNTLYGDGTLTIRYDNLEHIETSESIRIILEDGREFIGIIRGISNRSIEIDTRDDRLDKISTELIRRRVPESDFKESFFSQLRHRNPYWHGSLDLGFNFEKGAVHKYKVEAGLNVDRRKRPTRYLLTVRYAYEIQDAPDKEEVTSKDEFRALLLAEYDVAQRIFVFGLPAVEWDNPRGIRVRVYPAAGMGYRVIEKENGLLQLQLGLGYIYEDFVDFCTDRYASGYLGLECHYPVYRDIELNGIVYYLNLA